jgi:hypothetical protein
MHIFEMAAYPHRYLAACKLRQKLHSLKLVIINHYRVLPSNFDLPRSARTVFLEEIPDPAVAQYLTAIGAQFTYLICNLFAFFLPCGLKDVIVGSDLK